jgi:glycosyltransferase involved in cell wall biosynthesis
LTLLPRADKPRQVIGQVIREAAPEAAGSARGGCTQMPRVSVVIPCYNYGRYLRECVASVLAQEGVALDILIIDDASSDDSPQVAADLASKDSRVKVICHAFNHGHLHTYNEGLALVAGTYAVLLSPDDILTPGSLQRACALMEAHPEVGLVYGRPLMFSDDRPRPPAVIGPVRWTIWPGREWFEIRCRLIENCIRSPEVVLRSSLLKRIGLFRFELPHSGDLELWLRFALSADIAYVAGADQAYYRDHSAGMHHALFSGAIDDHRQISAAFEIIFRDHGEQIPDRPRIQRRVRRALNRRALKLACRVYDREPFDSTEATALEAMAGNLGFAGGLENDWRTWWVIRRLRMRKLLGASRWRMLLPVRHLATMGSRRWSYYRHRRLQRAGLLL